MMFRIIICDSFNYIEFIIIIMTLLSEIFYSIQKFSLLKIKQNKKKQQR